MPFAKAALRQALRRLDAAAPWLLPFVTDGRLASLRRPLYGLAPGLARRVAERQLLRGELAGARRELTAAGRRAPAMPRLDEAEAILATGSIESPLATAAPAATGSGGREAVPTILHAVHNALPIHPAGYALRTQRVLKVQAEAGWSTLACTRLGYPLDLYQPEIGRPPEKWEIDGVRYRLLPAEESLRRASTLQGYLAAYAQALAALAEAEGAEIIHGHSDYHNGLAAAWAAAASGRRSVYEARGLWHLTRLVGEPAFASNPLYRLAESLELEAMRQADRVVALSDGLRSWMIERGIDADKIAVVPNVIDAVRLTPQPRDEALSEALALQDRVVVGYVGSLTAYEGLETVLEALPRCREQGVPVAAVIVGDGAWRRPLKRHARRCGAAGLVRFVGQVPPGEVGRYYGLFDICPLLRRDEPVCRVVPPIKPLEIMAMAKPMIVSALPPLLELGEEGISRVSLPPGAGADALADCLIGLARQPDRRAAMGAAARDWVCRNRSPALLVERYRGIYEALCSDATRSTGAASGPAAGSRRPSAA